MSAGRNVQYELEIVDELPTREQSRTSQLEENIAKVVNSPSHHGKWVAIATYAQGTAATAAANVLRKRHGDVEEVEGWRFETRRVKVDINGVEEQRTKLFAKFSPDKVREGARKEFEGRLAARKAEIEAAKAAGKNLGNGKNAGAAAGNGASASGASGTSQQTPREQQGNKTTADVNKKAPANVRG